jgi:2-phosphosulfolactate phosphatase
MEIRHAGGVEGAATAEGAVVVIDVFRAFSVSAYALAGGACACRLVREVEQARDLADKLPGAVISAEVDGLPVDGIEISNSPTQITQADLSGRMLVQRSSAGTQAMGAAVCADRRFAASLVVAAATARALAACGTGLVTLVASRPDHLEDVACARLLEAYLRGAAPPHDLLAELVASQRYRRLASGAHPGSPATDYALALATQVSQFGLSVGDAAGAGVEGEGVVDALFGGSGAGSEGSG